MPTEAAGQFSQSSSFDFLLHPRRTVIVPGLPLIELETGPPEPHNLPNRDPKCSALRADRSRETVHRRRTVGIDSRDHAVVVQMPDLSECRWTKRGVKCGKRAVFVCVTVFPIIGNSIDHSSLTVATGDDPIVIDIRNVVVRITGIVEGGEASA